MPYVASRTIYLLTHDIHTRSHELYLTLSRESSTVFRGLGLIMTSVGRPLV
jgi:hypothetical protein